MTAAILITGPPGAGKSSVLERLATLLEIDGVSFGALELDHLGWGAPWLYGEPVLRQLAAILEVQRDAGRRLFLIAATAETDQELAAIAGAIDADALTVVLLSADADVVADRVERREPDDWPGKTALVDHARELAVSMPELTGIDLRLSTDDRRPEDVAASLFEMLGARGALPR